MLNCLDIVVPLLGKTILEVQKLNRNCNCDCDCINLCGFLRFYCDREVIATVRSCTVKVVEWGVLNRETQEAQLIKSKHI
jgi:hypothetical protein